MPEQSNIDPHNLLEDLLPFESCKKLLVIILVNWLSIQNAIDHIGFGFRSLSESQPTPQLSILTVPILEKMGKKKDDRNRVLKLAKPLICWA